MSEPDRRPYAIATIVSVAALSVAAGALARAPGAPPAAAPAPGIAATASSAASPATVEPMKDGSCGGLILGSSPLARLPEGTTFLPVSPTAPTEVRGVVVCGLHQWQIGDSCNLWLHDTEGHHAFLVLPNDQEEELTKILGKCHT